MLAAVESVLPPVSLLVIHNVRHVLPAYGALSPKEASGIRGRQNICSFTLQFIVVTYDLSFIALSNFRIYTSGVRDFLVSFLISHFRLILNAISFFTSGLWPRPCT